MITFNEVLMILFWNKVAAMFYHLINDKLCMHNTISLVKNLKVCDLFKTDKFQISFLFFKMDKISLPIF